MLLERSFIAWMICFHWPAVFDRIAPPPFVSAAVRSMSTATSRAATSRTRRAWLYRELGNERGIAGMLQRLANSAFHRGEFERSRALLAESQELAAGRFRYIEIPNITVLGRIDVLSGKVDRAAPSTVRRHGGRGGLALVAGGSLASLAILEVERDDLDEAEEDGREALAAHPAGREPIGDVRRHSPRSPAWRWPETIPAGQAFCGRSKPTERSPSRFWQLWRPDRAGPLLGEASLEFLSSVDTGRQLDLWDAVGIALGELELPQTEP